MCFWDRTFGKRLSWGWCLEVSHFAVMWLLVSLNWPPISTSRWRWFSLPRNFGGILQFWLTVKGSLEQQYMLVPVRKMYRKKKLRKWLETLGRGIWWSLRAGIWTSSQCFSRRSQNEVTLETISESAQGRAQSSSDGEKMLEESGKTEWDSGLETLDLTRDTPYPRAILQTSVRCTQPLQSLPHLRTTSIVIYLCNTFFFY